LAKNNWSPSEQNTTVVILGLIYARGHVRFTPLWKNCETICHELRLKGISKASLHRVLTVLGNQGKVERRKKSRKFVEYSLNPKNPEARLWASGYERIITGSNLDFQNDKRTVNASLARLSEIPASDKDDRHALCKTFVSANLMKLACRIMELAFQQAEYYAFDGTNDSLWGRQFEHATAQTFHIFRDGIKDVMKKDRRAAAEAYGESSGYIAKKLRDDLTKAEKFHPSQAMLRLKRSLREFEGQPFPTK
jgi:hypothetical protein